MMLYCISLLILQILVVGVNGQDASDLARLFESSLSPDARIMAGEARERWSVWDKPSFLLTITPATEEDVQKIVSQGILITYNVALITEPPSS